MMSNNYAQKIKAEALDISFPIAYGLTIEQMNTLGL